MREAGEDDLAADDLLQMADEDVARNQQAGKDYQRHDHSDQQRLQRVIDVDYPVPDIKRAVNQAAEHQRRARDPCRILVVFAQELGFQFSRKPGVQVFAHHLPFARVEKRAGRG